MQKPSAPGRIEVFDYLRGFFILVIIVDHLYRWPNLFQFVSGRGELWVSAAEGFVIISGLLVGYIRGRKNLKYPIDVVSRKLVGRGLMLYVWSIIMTLLLVALSWYLHFRSPIAFIPYAQYDWSSLLHDTITLAFSHTLIHFLYLYAIFLILAPILVWLLRKGLWWLGAAASVALWWYGYVRGIEWMQWQALFYLPATAGFYLDQSIAFFARLPRYAPWLFASLGLASIIWSMAVALPQTPGTYHPDLFSREPVAAARIGLSFVWFVTLAFLFHKSQRFIHRFFGWLLLPLGTKSLTAYISHTVPLMILVLLLPPTTSIWVNTLLTIAAILVTWAIVKIPGINRVIPR